MLCSFEKKIFLKYELKMRKNSIVFTYENGIKPKKKCLKEIYFCAFGIEGKDF